MQLAIYVWNEIYIRPEEFIDFYRKVEMLCAEDFDYF